MYAEIDICIDIDICILYIIVVAEGRDGTCLCLRDIGV